MAAGRGERVGTSEGPKQYRLIGGHPVIWYSVRTFIENPDISPVIVVIHPDDFEIARKALQEFADKIIFVNGGATRQQSTLYGLQALENFQPDYVHIHDGARPFVQPEQLAALHQCLNPQQGALLALPVSDTLKLSDTSNNVVKTIPRAQLYSAQTPQSFPYSAILTAHQKLAFENRNDFTDDASIAEWAGLGVKIVESTPDNIKITWKQDIENANNKLAKGKSMFPDIRTGNGYDVHSFEDGDHVTLCGVAIPHEKKLNGHSDADVALHALTDALLSTCGAGDIGTHFPPSDLQWKGAASAIFVKHAADIIRTKGGRIANVAITLIAEAPRIGPYREQMTENLAHILDIAKDRVSLTATTNEKIGFIGRKEGIAAIATASIAYPGEISE